MDAKDAEWIKVGARVAEYTTGTVGTPARATPATIERLTTTQIILDNGSRYNRAKLEPVGGRHDLYRTTKLLRLTDPRVVAAIEAKIVRSLWSQVVGKIDTVIKGRPETKDELIFALERLNKIMATAQSLADGIEAFAKREGAE